MSQKPNYFVIGLFVLGSLVVFVAGIIVFGSGALFRETQSYVTFFQGSVKGLRQGSPVLFRGVRIGEVKHVHLQVDHSVEEVRIPVVFTIYPDSILEVGKRPEGMGRVAERMIEQGLRARLELESLVTGLLAVNLNFFPDTEPVFVGKLPQYMEIPSIPSTLDVLSDALGGISVKDIVFELQRTARGISTLVESDDFQQLPFEFRQSLKELRTFIGTAEALVKEVRTEVKPLSDEAKQTALAVKTTLAEVQGTFTEVNRILAEDSATRTELQALVRDVRGAAVQLRDLGDYLERNPDALLTGR